jgi:hypothetical protein
MRRGILLLTAFPAADALSLANFQQITSILIPLSCQLTYDSQIPSCAVSDFQNGCSSECEGALTSVAESVSEACSDVTVNSNTLLGIVKNGGILEALCITAAKTTSTISRASSSAIQRTSTHQPTDSVTLPTTSPGVQVTTTMATISASSSQTSISTSSTIPVATTTTESIPSTAVDPSTSVGETSATVVGGGAPTGTKQITSSTSKAAAATQNASDQSDSGGGSPFDISSNGAGHIDGGSILLYTIALCGGLLLVR